jgi:aminoglycoside/choline kinase family phosphotransferase
MEIKLHYKLIKHKENRLKKLFLDWAGEEIVSFEPVTGSGSNRQYFRMTSSHESAIGVIGEDKKENLAFLTFSTHFKKYGLNVPEVFISDEKEGIYLLQNLGNISLFSLLSGSSGSTVITPELEGYYKKVLDDLISFQVGAGKKLDYSVCYPIDKFDWQSMQWDLNYFKYYYLRPTNIPFHEKDLENDFQTLIDFLALAESDYFMYRDFQTRNIMICNNKPWYIDFQGGRKGPLQYDLASLLFQAKADLPFGFREEMLEYYLAQLNLQMPVDRNTFIPLYYGFVLIRTLQVLGAYGYRGFFERKTHFVESIHYALDNLEWLLNNVEFSLEIPELQKCMEEMILNGRKKNKKTGSENLTVEIRSFSYLQQGIPDDKSGHGGGFVFDCRSLPNPGRKEEFRKLSGLDKSVMDLLSSHTEVDKFIDNVYRLVSQSVDKYIMKGFNHLSVDFGCTGGQHRSVYCSERIYEKLKSKYNIRVIINHTMKDKW